ncbi:MAG: hypothetical protein HPY55_00240 [Firmicutes bacterium]|nr:hypothetical protein [Bacillota bacterium]
MRCFSEEELDAYLDGDETPGLEEHAGRCAVCAATLAAMREIRSRLESLDFELPPQALAPRVMTEVLSSPPGLRSRILAVASLGSAGVAGYLLTGLIRDRLATLVAAVLGRAGAFPSLVRLAQGMAVDARTTLWVMFRIPQVGLACLSAGLAMVGLGLIIAGLLRDSRSQMDYKEEVA